MSERTFQSVRHEPIWDLANAQFSLGENTIHGEDHWQRVYGNALEIGHTSGADIEVASLFAILHDCCRESDGDDPEHGPRAARFTAEISAQYLSHLTKEQLAILLFAIAHHTSPETTNDPTLGTCFDADRLEYGRDGSVLDADYMSTEAARLKVRGINAKRAVNVSLFPDTGSADALSSLVAK